MPAPTFVGAGVQGDAQSGNVTLGAPPSPQPGDFWVAVVHTARGLDDDDQHPHQFPDWTRIYEANGGGTDSRLSVWWHRYQGVTPNLTLQRQGTNSAIGGVAAFRGVSGIATIGAGNSGTDSSIEHVGITPAVADTMVLAMNGAGDDNTRTLPSGWSAAFEDPVSGTQNCYIFNAPTNPDNSVACFFRAWPGGFTGQVVSNMNASDDWASVMIALAGVEPRNAQVSWAELEVPTAARRARVSVAEVQVPLAPRAGRVSHAELQTPPGAREGQASFAELQVPAGARSAQVSVAELEVGLGARRGRVSHAEMLVPLGARLAQVSWAEIEVPHAGRSGQVSVAWLETPLGQRRGQSSWAELQTPAEARRALVSRAEYELRDEAEAEARELRKIRLVKEGRLGMRKHVLLTKTLADAVVIGQPISDVRNPVPAFPAQFITPSPSTRPIRIVRAFARIHHHGLGRRTGAYETAIAVFRASDMQLLFGVVLDQTPPLAFSPFAERDWDFNPQYYTLQPNDALIVLTFMFGPFPEAEGTTETWGIFVTIGYEEEV